MDLEWSARTNEVSTEYNDNYTRAPNIKGSSKCFVLLSVSRSLLHFLNLLKLFKILIEAIRFAIVLLWVLKLTISG